MKSEQPYSTRHHSIAVWELTLACNLRCSHCGSSAGKARGNELNTQEALETVNKLQQRGITEVTLIGGEATLRQDWEMIARAIVSAGMRLTLQTGGFHVDQALAQRIVDTGVYGVGVSLDGSEDIHDGLRGRQGSYKRGLQAIDHLKEAGLKTVTVNTQINRLNWQNIPQLFESLINHGVKGWMLMPTIPMGAALSDQLLCLQPYDFEALHELMGVLSAAGRQNGMAVVAGNAMGYFGPYERLMRDPGEGLVNYGGCPAGTQVLGLEADGTVKGCPSLPTDLYATGHVLEDGIERLDQLLFGGELSLLTHDRQSISNPYRRHVEGFCLRCPFTSVCKGGCTWASSSIQGKRGDNPYCMFRSIAMNASGKHEVMVQLSAGDIGPFSRGDYRVEVRDGDPTLDTATDASPINLDNVSWPQSLAEIALRFKQQRGSVRESVGAVLQAHRAFPTLNRQDTVDRLLESMENRTSSTKVSLQHH